MAQLVGYPGGYGGGNTTDIDTVQKNPLRTRGFDASGNEYIYLSGVASTVAGDLVTYDELGVTARSGAGAIGPAAVAQAATVASTFGWYCIFGLTTINTGAAVADNAKVFLHATAGTVDDASVAGDQLVFAVFRSAAGGAATASVQLNYPSVGVNVA